MPDLVHLTIYQGDDYEASVYVTEEDGKTPADLTGFKVDAHIRLNAADPSPDGVAQFQTAVDGSTITLGLSHDETRLLTKDFYKWDLQLIDTTGWVTTVLAGNVILTKDVTKVGAAPGRQ